MSEKLTVEVDTLILDWSTLEPEEGAAFDATFDRLVTRSDAICFKVARELRRDTVLQFLLERQVRAACENHVPDGTAFAEVLLGEWLPQVVPEFERGEPLGGLSQVKEWMGDRLSAVRNMIASQEQSKLSPPPSPSRPKKGRNLKWLEKWQEFSDGGTPNPTAAVRDWWNSLRVAQRQEYGDPEETTSAKVRMGLIAARKSARENQ